MWDTVSAKAMSVALTHWPQLQLVNIWCAPAHLVFLCTTIMTMTYDAHVITEDVDNVFHSLLLLTRSRVIVYPIYKSDVGLSYAIQ